MNFSVFFRSTGLRILSVLAGAITGGAVCLFADWRIGVLAGAVMTLVLSLVLPLVFYLHFFPYVRLKRDIKQRLLFDIPVRFTAGEDTVGGFFLLTEKSVILLSLERQESKIELTRDKIARVCRGKDDLILDIHLNNNQFVRVFSGACEELIAILREHGWTVTE